MVPPHLPMRKLRTSELNLVPEVTGWDKEPATGATSRDFSASWVMAPRRVTGQSDNEGPE